MPVYFFDSSALVKRYAQETGTAWVQTLTAQHYVFLATVTEVEVIAAIERRKRIQTLTPTEQFSLEKLRSRELQCVTQSGTKRKKPL